MRVSFIGGGTDIPEFYRQYTGRVISTTIDKYVYVMVKERWEDKIRVSYAQNEEIEDIENIKNTRVKAVLDYFGIEKGIEIVSWADLPAQIGLGGSSSFTVGLINAVSHFLGKELTKEELAQLACKIEIEILKEPIGKQDQYIAAYGGFNMFEFLPNELVNIRKLKMPKEFKDYLLFLFTGMYHDSKVILEDMKKTNAEMNLERLAKSSLIFLEQLKTGNPAYWGEIIYQGWRLKKNLSPLISNNFIDEMYEKVKYSGIYGGKLLGAGGGGVFMFVVPPKKREQVKKALNLKEIKINFTNDGSTIIQR